MRADAIHPGVRLERYLWQNHDLSKFFEKLVNQCFTCIAELNMLAIRLPRDIENRLGKLAEETGRTKTFYARQELDKLGTSERHRILKFLSERLSPLEDPRSIGDS